MIDIQHQFVSAVVSTLHVHLSHHDCLEIIVVRGKAGDLNQLADNLISVKGVKQGYFRVINPRLLQKGL